MHRWVQDSLLRRAILRNDLTTDDADYEACDDGNEVDEDACLTGCRVAVCGDGVVHADVGEGAPVLRLMTVTSKTPTAAWRRALRRAAAMVSFAAISKRVTSVLKPVMTATTMTRARAVKLWAQRCSDGVLGPNEAAMMATMTRRMIATIACRHRAGWRRPSGRTL